MGGRRLAVAAGLRRAARRIERSTTPETGLVWLFGPPRSGTTWLHGMIRAHPDVDGPNEPLLGAHLGITDAAANPGRPGPERLLTDTSAARNDYLLAAEHEAVWAPIIADLVHARCLAPYRRVLGRGGRVVVKEPHGAHACALLHRITPESRCLFIVRDPRDVLDSVLDIVEAGWSGQSIGRGELDARDRRRLFDLVATRWRLTVSEMTALHDRLGTGPGAPAHLVRYEDLRAEPVTNLGAIVRWMGLDAPPTWAAETAALLDFDALPADVRGSGRFHRAATPGLWREHLSADEAAWAEETFATELERFGYDV